MCVVHCVMPNSALYERNPLQLALMGLVTILPPSEFESRTLAKLPNAARRSEQAVKNAALCQYKRAEGVGK